MARRDTSNALDVLEGGPAEGTAAERVSRAGRGVAFVVLALLGILALRGALPERYPAVDGDLTVHVVRDEDPDRDERLTAAGVQWWPPVGRSWLVADATWATAGPVPSGRTTCRVVVLAAFPDSEQPPGAGAASGRVRVGWPPEARRVLSQYREVLPPTLVRQLDGQPLAFLLPAGDTGSVSLAWPYDDPLAAERATALVRLLIAPVCDDAVHGLVELGRPR